MPSATDENQATTFQRGEPRWPASVTVLALMALVYTLPEWLTPGPSWVVPAIMLVLAVLTIWTFRTGRHVLNNQIGTVLVAVVTVTLIWSLVALIKGLPSKHVQPTELLRAAVALWVSNVLVFASWYWRLDAGGPHARFVRSTHSDGSFLFPQMTLPPDSPHSDEDWKPGFVDYLFLAFNTSTAFSPTDVPVLDRNAKLLMIVQSSISLCTLAILAARAINIL